MFFCLLPRGLGPALLLWVLFIRLRGAVLGGAVVAYAVFLFIFSSPGFLQRLNIAVS